LKRSSGKYDVDAIDGLTSKANTIAKRLNQHGATNFGISSTILCVTRTCV